MATIEDFRKIEMCTARIVEAVEHPNADKLYVLKVDIGGEIRQVVAGIRLFYGKEELAGREVIFVKNLAPAVIRGIESNGMVLAAKDESALTLLALDKQVKTGSPVS